MIDISYKLRVYGERILDPNQEIKPSPIHEEEFNSLSEAKESIVEYLENEYYFNNLKQANDRYVVEQLELDQVIVNTESINISMLDLKS